MARVKVKLFGVFRVDTHVAEVELDSDKLRDVFGALSEKLAVGRMDSGLEFKDALVYVNGEACHKKSRKLSDGDEIWLLSPSSGG